MEKGKEEEENVVDLAKFEKEEERIRGELAAEQKADREQSKIDFDAERERKKLDRLKSLLEKTSLYSHFLASRIEENKAKTRTARPSKPSTKKGKGKETPQPRTDTSLPQTDGASVQPRLVTGGTLRDYQIQGVEWLISMYENGLNGILADEMGLGKTIQCISFLAHLRDMGVWGPFLIVAPLATLVNWVNEFQRFAPTIPVIVYHGTPPERAQLREAHLLREDPSMPVIVTSYEIFMIDRNKLQRIRWKYLVVDEGHRLKNFNCRLMRELKSVFSSNRLLLTGTPLQNNLTELWSLMNFLLPEVFDDLTAFQNWFDFSLLDSENSEQKILEEEQRTQFVSRIHQILKPFLLRRLKMDVELALPKKKEVLIFAPMTARQLDLSKAILAHRIQEFLGVEKAKQLRLQHSVMQLRKACNHPYLFDTSDDIMMRDLQIMSQTRALGRTVEDPDVVKLSGKMQVLDQLLPALKERNHKVLLFSQMTTMLDIIEDYVAQKDYKHCRVDGSTPYLERQSQINAFNNQPDVFLFLLTTRAGGLGINLASADTVILYDSDWNPQMDMQAQDRCHRIGQTRPVCVYRLLTRDSIEVYMYELATKKRALERLVISQNKFKGLQTPVNLQEGGGTQDSTTLVQKVLRGYREDQIDEQELAETLRGIKPHDTATADIFVDGEEQEDNAHAASSAAGRHVGVLPPAVFERILDRSGLHAGDAEGAVVQASTPNESSSSSSSSSSTAPLLARDVSYPSDLTAADEGPSAQGKRLLAAATRRPGSAPPPSASDDTSAKRRKVQRS